MSGQPTRDIVSTLERIAPQEAIVEIEKGVPVFWYPINTAARTRRSVAVFLRDKASHELPERKKVAVSLLSAARRFNILDDEILLCRFLKDFHE